MALQDLTLRDVALTLAYLLGGTLGTAVGAVLALRLLQPLRPAVYHAYYLAVGPWSATEAASVLPFVVAALGTATVVTAAAVGVANDRALALRVAGGLAAAVATVLALVATALYLGAEPLLVGLVAVVAVAVAVPVGLRRAGAWEGGGPTFLGAAPVMVLLVLLLGVGLGWGGGYDLVAREVPEGEVQEPVATFEGYPQVREDLLSPDDGTGTYAYCETTDRRRTCRLPLRGYDHAVAAARFLADNGVRCRFQGATGPDDRNRSFLAVHEGTHYRVTCQSYGD